MGRRHDQGLPSGPALRPRSARRRRRPTTRRPSKKKPRKLCSNASSPSTPHAPPRQLAASSVGCAPSSTPPRQDQPTRLAIARRRPRRRRRSRRQTPLAQDPRRAARARRARRRRPLLQVRPNQTRRRTAPHAGIPRPGPPIRRPLLRLARNAGAATNSPGRRARGRETTRPARSIPRARRPGLLIEAPPLGAPTNISRQIQSHCASATRPTHPQTTCADDALPASRCSRALSRTANGSR